MMYTMSNALRASITVMTTTMMLIGRMAGNTTLKKVCAAVAPSMAAASFRVGSTPFRPARYKIMM